MTTTRTASAVTLRCRAHNRAERLREKVADARIAEMKRRATYDGKMEQLDAELHAAEADLNGLSVSYPVGSDESELSPVG